MSRKIGRTALVAVWLASVGPGVANAVAQMSNFGPYDVDASKPRAPGWTVTPGIAVGTGWDDNVLSRANGDAPVGDYTNVISPSVGLSLNGRFDQLNASYSGALLRYRQFDPLNTYNQQAAASWRRALSKRFTLVADESFTRAPTTELVQVVGVPFVRTGTTVEDARAGIEAKLTARSTLLVNYNFEVLQFDSNPFTPQLQGGHSHGVTAGYRYKVSELTTLVADYEGQNATITNELGTFVIQNIYGGVERRISELTYVFGSLGLARVAVSAYGPAQTGPAWRAGIARQFMRAGFDLTYSRSVVPSYGFGGTLQNQEVLGRVRVPLARRISVQSSVAWRSNQALTIGQPNLHSFWFESDIGYAWQPWLRLEGYYLSANQSIEGPGGLVERRQIGVQLVTAHPMRIR
jgi:hypothetical protein